MDAMDTDHLAALDDDQRVVAPPCTPAVRPGRGRHGEDPRDHAPHRPRSAQRRPPSQHLLAVTFTARAAGEMRSRLRDLGVAGVQARTFHSAALRQLTFFWPQAIGGGGVPRIQEHKAPLVAEAAGGSGSASTRSRSGTSPVRSSGPRSPW